MPDKRSRRRIEMTDQTHWTHWTPDTTTTRHTGSPIPLELDFFAEPPSDIGKILSADTTLTNPDLSNHAQRRIRNCILWGLGGGVGMGAIFWINELPFWIGAVIGLVMAVICVLLSSQYFHQCSYVGEYGITLHSLKGNRSAQPKTQTFYYQDGKNLYTYQTRRYYNGVYTGTTFNYRWTRHSGSDFKISGAHRSENGHPPEGNLWYFARAAEDAWSNFLLGSLNEQLNQLGYVEFPISGALNAVRIGLGFMEFEEKKGNCQRVNVADMQDIRLGNGVFQFKHKDATWWSGKGKYSFSYSTIPNARLFIICLDKLAGIRW